MADLNALIVRQKYSQFRILVIGRANAGKTTLLKRVLLNVKSATRPVGTSKQRQGRAKHTNW